MFKRNEFNGFIGIFENYFNPLFLKELLDYYNSIKDLPLRQGPQPLKHLKDDQQLYILDPCNIGTLHTKYTSIFLKTLWEEIFPVYADHFTILKEKSYKVDQVKMKKIQPGGGFHQWHYEALGHDSLRRLVVQLYINDIDEAGETEFLYQNLRIKPKANKLLIWPADWTHTHRGNPPIGNTDKYILTTWLLEADKEVYESSSIQ